MQSMGGEANIYLIFFIPNIIIIVVFVDADSNSNTYKFTQSSSKVFFFCFLN